MTDVVPIRTLPRDVAMQAEPGDRIACADDDRVHVVREKSWNGGGGHDTWVRIVCSCGQVFSGAIR